MLQNIIRIVSTEYKNTILRKRNKLLEDSFRMIEPSLKQRKVLTWWRDSSPYKNYFGIICDGAIRSGKTSSVIYSFITWSMTNFNRQNFILSGKTIGAFKRNILKDLVRMLRTLKFEYSYNRADNVLVVTLGEVTNYYYVFGGKDEKSTDLVQGLTAAGAFFDEAVLMPKSFLDQAIARCSVEGSKVWFTCNPDNPHHFFKKDFIDMASEKKLLYLHFTMEDNPTLSENKIQQYKLMYKGSFYERFILGLWVMAEGLVYQIIGDNFIDEDEIPVCDYYYITCDYGIYNPMAWNLVGVLGNEVYVMEEYHHSGRESNETKTDEQYTKEFLEWKKRICDKYGIEIEYTIVDPSASSFIVSLEQEGQYVVKANNKVFEEDSERISGIPLVQIYLNKLRLFVCRNCIETIKEFYSYRWDEKKSMHGEEVPVKENDHHMDGIRYFFNTVIGYYYKDEYDSGEIIAG